MGTGSRSERTLTGRAVGWILVTCIFLGVPLYGSEESVEEEIRAVVRDFLNEARELSRECGEPAGEAPPSPAIIHFCAEFFPSAPACGIFPAVVLSYDISGVRRDVDERRGFGLISRQNEPFAGFAPVEIDSRHYSLIARDLGVIFENLCPWRMESAQPMNAVSGLIAFMKRQTESGWIAVKEMLQH